MMPANPCKKMLENFKVERTVVDEQVRVLDQNGKDRRTLARAIFIAIKHCGRHNLCKRCVA